MILSRSTSSAGAILAQTSNVGVRNSGSIKLAACRGRPAFPDSAFREAPRFLRSAFKGRATSGQMFYCLRPAEYFMAGFNQAAATAAQVSAWYD